MSAACTATWIAIRDESTLASRTRSKGRPAAPSAQHPSGNSPSSYVSIPSLGMLSAIFHFHLRCTPSHCPLPSSLVSLPIADWRRLEVNDHEYISHPSLSSDSSPRNLHLVHDLRHAGRVWGSRAGSQKSRRSRARSTNVFENYPIQSVDFYLHDSRHGGTQVLVQA